MQWKTLHLESRCGVGGVNYTHEICPSSKRCTFGTRFCHWYILRTFSNQLSELISICFGDGKKGRNKSFESHFSLCSLLTSSSISLILVRLNSVGHCFDWIFNCDRRTSAWPRKLGARFKCAFIDSNMYSVWVGVLGGEWDDDEKKEKKRNSSSIIPIPNEGYLKWIISPPDGFELVWNFLHR